MTIAVAKTVSSGTRKLPPLGEVTVAFGISFGLSALILATLGYNPATVVIALMRGAVGSTFSLGQSLAVAVPLILTGLAAAIPFSARLWNLGGEGQMAVGGVSSVLVALMAPIPDFLLLPAVLVAGCLGGAFWGLVPGILRALFGANEVIVTIMMNFVGLLLVALVASGPLRSYSAQTISIPDAARLPGLFNVPNLHAGVFLALAAVAVASVIILKSRLGFEIRAVGLNRDAARWSGLRPTRVTIVAFFLGGTFAGLAGAIEVSGKSYALVQDFTGQLGLLGIVVALVARLHPVAIIPSGLFFAFVTVGGSALPAAVGLDQALSVMLIGLFVLTLFATHALKTRGRG